VTFEVLPQWMLRMQRKTAQGKTNVAADLADERTIEQ
jgi:hypothetical protein